MTASIQALERAQRVAEEHNTGIGGSQIHHVFSLPPYGCARQLAYHKRGFTPDHPFHGNRATERGSRLEDFAAEIYTEQTGRQIRRPAGALTGAAKRDSKHPFMLCRADREIINDTRGPGMLSIKVPGREMFHRVKYEGIPASWSLQLQFEMSIWDRPWGDHGIFWPDGWEMLPSADVERDDALVREVRQGVESFWHQYIEPVDAPLPPKLDAKDSRCGRCPFRTTCQGGELVALMGKDAGAIELPYDPSLAELVQLHFEHKDIVDQAVALLEETDNKLKAAMGDVQACRAPGGRIYNRLQAGRVTYQTKEYLKAHPDQQGDMAKFTNTGKPFRRFIVYPE